MSDLQNQIRRTMQERGQALQDIQERERAKVKPETRLVEAEEKLSRLQVQQAALNRAPQAQMIFDQQLGRMKEEWDQQQETIKELHAKLNDFALFNAPDLLNRIDADWCRHLKDVQQLLAISGAVIDARAIDALAKVGIGPEHTYYDEQMQIQSRAQYIRLLNDLPVMFDGNMVLVAWVASSGLLPQQVKAGLAYAAGNMPGRVLDNPGHPHHGKPINLGYLPAPDKNYNAANAAEHAKKLRHDHLMSGTGV